MFHSTLNLQTKTWILTGLGLLILFAAVPALAQKQGGAQKIRVLPAAADPPQQVVEEEKRLQRATPNPPAKGKGVGHKPRPASSEPPASEQALQAQLNRKVPNPPGRANKKRLEDRIRNLPGGNDRADAARGGKPPGAAGQNETGANLSKQSSAEGLLAQLRSFFIDDAYAQATLSFDLTPPSNWSSGQGSSAYFYNALVGSGLPNNSYVLTGPYNFSNVGGSTQTPIMALYLSVPSDGWYIINMNAFTNGANTLSVRHYEGGSYPVIATFAMQTSAYADYPMLEYLSAGMHYFYFAMTSYTYVSRISVDSYP